MRTFPVTIQMDKTGRRNLNNETTALSQITYYGNNLILNNHLGLYYLYLCYLSFLSSFLSKREKVVFKGKRSSGLKTEI